MSLQSTFERISADIERGDLGKARDRLEGLLHTYPDELEVRRKLGEVYWALRYPDRAGQHWYLLPDDNPEMGEAKRAFAARHGNDARMMLDAIRWRGGLDSLRGTYADEVLRGLAKRGRLSESDLERIVRPREPGERQGAYIETFWDRHILKVIMAVAFSVVALVIIGFLTVVDFVIGLLR